MTMENSDDIRLIVKIAQLYYEQDMTLRRKLLASWDLSHHHQSPAEARPRAGHCYHRHQL